VRTTIGFGSPHKAGKASAHGSPLGAGEVVLTKKALGWEKPEESFYQPAEALEHFHTARERGKAAQKAWEERFAAYEQAFPDLAAAWRQAQAGELPAGWDAALPAWEPGTKEATRVSAGKTLNALAAKVPWLLGGDADLSGSTKTHLAEDSDFDGRSGQGRNIHFGVREHAMGAIANGMAYHGGLRPYTATFFVFSDYMRPAMRLAAMNRLPVVFVFTHDSIALGEDGPTHQPVEHLMALRVIPGLAVVRPGDPEEAAQAWRFALGRTEGPTVLVLSRQGLKVPDRAGCGLGSAEDLSRGAYVLAEASGGKPAALLLATGSEVGLALAARERLEKEGVPTRVVSMPCWEAFAAADEAWRNQVLPPGVTVRVSIEAGVTLGWDRWIGPRGRALGIDRFGASAPGAVNLEKFGFTPEAVASAVRGLLESR